MPTYQTAKTIAENALSTIGAFPSSQSQPDAGELRKALIWLEMSLNSQSGIRPTAGFWDVIDIPVQSGIGDYDLDDYDVAIQHVFSASIVTTLGNIEPLTIISENKAMMENLKDTGTPERATITRDVKPVLKVYPTPTSSDEESGLVIRLRFQRFHEAIDGDGTNDTNVSLRPSWYLWITKKLAYEIGSGPVRRLSDGELDRFLRDAEKLESSLYARDGQYNSSRPPMTGPMEGSMF